MGPELPAKRVVTVKAIMGAAPAGKHRCVNRILADKRAVQAVLYKFSRGESYRVEVRNKLSLTVIYNF